MSVEVNPHIDRIRPYIPGKPIDEVKRDLGLPSAIKLASNENNWGIPGSVKRKLARKIKDLFLYPDGTLYKLRAELAKIYNVDKGQLIFGNGSDEILQLVALTYLGPDKEALLSEGTFSEYEFCARLVNAPFQTIPLKNYAFDLEAFAKSITSKTRVIFLCNPNNPTGTYYSKTELDTFMEQVPSHVLVVLDEAYFEFAQGDDYPNGLDYLAKYPRVIVLRTFSKIWSLAGLRLGYGIASEKLISEINKARQPFNVNRFSEEAALLMLAQKNWARDIVKKVGTEKNKLYQRLDVLGVSYLKSRTNFVFIHLNRPAKDVAEALLKRGVIVRPMNGFGFPAAIRVTIGLPKENIAFIKALKEVIK
jgi:histidinol-phosphate aminotransferase